MSKWLPANLTTSQPHSGRATCHCLSCVFLSIYFFCFCQADSLSVFDCESAHLSLHSTLVRPCTLVLPSLPPLIICLCVDHEPPEQSTYTQHTVDTTNLTIISAQIISSGWNGRQHGGREETRERD